MEKIIEMLKLIQERKEYGELTIKYESGNFVMLEEKKKILIAETKKKFRKHHVSMVT